MNLGNKHCETGELRSQIKVTNINIYHGSKCKSEDDVSDILLNGAERVGSESMIGGADDTSDIMGEYLLT